MARLVWKVNIPYLTRILPLLHLPKLMTCQHFNMDILVIKCNELCWQVLLVSLLCMWFFFLVFFVHRSCIQVRESQAPQEVSLKCVCVCSLSRAVQKSLAIIRQARQKKQQAKNYCMYYNRFGKCNRGPACPYIHDPDKVAVCTRYFF